MSSIRFAVAVLLFVPSCSCAMSHEAPDDGGALADAADAARADAPPDEDAPDAATGGPSWRWSSPRPVGNDLASVWGASPTDVWAVGAQGTLLHYDGREWTAVPSGTARNLRGVWGSSSDDVWVVGGETIWTFDDVDSGIILHWDGRAWSQYLPGLPGLMGVWGTGPRDVWVVGQGNILHFDGVAWTTQRSGADLNLRAVWAVAPDDVWAVGDYPPLLHYDGSSWARQPADHPGGTGDSGEVWGTSASDVWTASRVRGLAHWDGSAWSTAPGSRSGYVGIGGTAPDDVWAVGPFGISHWAGDAWTEESIPTSTYLYDVWAGARDDAWAVGERGTILHWNGASWAGWSPVLPSQHIEAVWASAPDDVWAVGWDELVVEGGRTEERTTILHGDGETWTVAMSDARVPWGDRALNEVWGSAPDDVWAVGDWGMTWHWDGAAWSLVPTGVEWALESVWGSAPDDVWAVGSLGVLHWDGRAWTEVGDEHWLYAVWGSGSDDVWAAGDYGRVIHWDGAAWTPVTIDALADAGRVDAFDLWGSGPSDVWMTAGLVGATTSLVEGGVLLHWDGTTWTSEPAIPLSSVWGSGPDDIWAAGWQGTLHFDGARWSPVVEPPFDIVTPTDVSGLAADDVWMVDWDGRILHRTR